MVRIKTDTRRHIGLDIGTSSVSAAVIDAASSRVVSVVSRPHGGEIASRSPDEHLQDPRRLLEAARALLDGVVARHGPVGAIGVTGQMHGILYLDEAGRAVSPLYTWLDARAGRNGPDGEAYVDTLERLTGRRIPVGFGAATHFVNLRTGAVPPSARWICSIPDYVAMHLAGANRPVTDPTLADGFGLYDPERGGFDQEAWVRLGEPRLTLPQVIDAGGVVGEYAGERAREDGVPQAGKHAGEHPICTPIGDNQASFLGSVRDPDRSVLVNIGTSGQISCLDALLRPPDALPAGRASDVLERRPYPGGRTLYVGASLAGGKALEILASLLAEIIEAGGGSGRDPYELMDGVTASPPGPNLRVDTRFAGSRSDPEVRGSIQGITLHNFTLGHLVYGFCQGIVDELHQLWVGSSASAQAGQGLEYLVGSGNALRASRLLRERLGAVFARPLYVPAYTEEAAVGAALHAAAIAEGRPADALAREVVRYEPVPSQAGGRA